MSRPRRYRRRPVVVDAVQYTGVNLDEITEILGGAKQAKVTPVTLPGPGRGLRPGIHVHTMTDDAAAAIGDWIVQDEHGELTVYSAAQFEAAYDVEPDHPVGAVIEIVEQRGPDGPQGIGAEILVPKEIRVNGQRLLIPKDAPPVRLHEVRFPPDDAVMVTLTVFARRIVVDAEVSPRH